MRTRFVLQRLLPVLALLGTAAAACELAPASDTRFRLEVSTEPAELAFDRVRLELSLEDGIGTWERRRDGAGALEVEPESRWSGRLRAWALAEDAAGPRVVGYGEILDGEPGAVRAAVELRAAADRDGDWVPDAQDLCPDRADPEQLDTDGDDRGDACDLCPENPDPGQEDRDEDGWGDACDPAVCGNGVPEPGEACDDGNTDEADACDTACRRVLRCGNGVLDPGEACDDGNGEDADSCSNACRHRAALRDTCLDCHAELPGAGRLVTDRAYAAWFERPAAGSRGTLVVGMIDAVTGAFLDRFELEEMNAPRLVSLGRLADEDSLGLVWRGQPAGSSDPGAAWRLHAARRGLDGWGVEEPTELLVADLLPAWGTLAGVPRAVTLATPERAACGEPVAGSRYAGWPLESAGPLVETGQWACAAELVGAERDRGGMLTAWLAASGGDPAAEQALWARRWDETLAPVDAAELRVDAHPAGGPVLAAWEPVDDRYVLVAFGRNPGDPRLWYTLPADGSGPVEGPRSSPEPSPLAKLLPRGDGTLIAVTFEGCEIHALPVDVEGRVLGDAVITDVAPDEELRGCTVDLVPLPDGRALLGLAVLRPSVDGDPRVRGAGGARFLPSLASLLEPEAG